MQAITLVIAPTEYEFNKVSGDNKVWIKSLDDLDREFDGPIANVVKSRHVSRVLNHKRVYHKAVGKIGFVFGIVTPKKHEYEKYRQIHKGKNIAWIKNIDDARDYFYIDVVYGKFANQIENIVEIMCVINNRFVVE